MSKSRNVNKSDYQISAHLRESALSEPTQFYLSHALFRSENISIIQDELEGTTITTVTRKKIFI